MHYYPHHIGDFVRDTARLTDSQSMAYLRLIWMYYENEEPLEDDTKKLAFLIGSDVDTVAMLLQCYFNANALRWHHNRIDSVLMDYKNKSEKARNSAKTRWNNANAMRTHNERNANGMLTNNQEPITNNKPKTIVRNTSARFDEFWIAWPSTQRKTRKKQCLQKWKSKNLDEKADQIIENVEALKLTKKWRDGFEPAPMSYLNGELWLDDVIANVDAAKASKSNRPWYIVNSEIESRADKNNLEAGKAFPFRKAAVFKLFKVTAEMEKQARDNFDGEK